MGDFSRSQSFKKIWIIRALDQRKEWALAL